MEAATPMNVGQSSRAASTVLVRVDFTQGWNRVGDTADAHLRQGRLDWYANLSRNPSGDFVVTGVRVPGGIEATMEAMLQSHFALQPWFERRNKAIQELVQMVSPDYWRAGASTPDTAWAALAHLYQALVHEGTHDVVTILEDLMQAPSRASVATRLRRARSKGFLTESTQGVVAGRPTELAQSVLPWSWSWPKG